MKTKYFGYYFKDHDSGKKHFFDLRSLLYNFTLVSEPEYKNSFIHEEENLYLFPVEENIFLFLETRNTDFFRKIRRSDLSLQDLKSVIDGDSKLGYASYIIFGENHFGIASTYMAPGLTAFSFFMNDIIGSLKTNNLEFCVKPLLSTSKASDVLKLNVIGRTSIEIPRTNHLVQDMMNLFAADISNDLSLGSIEIVFKPVQRGNIKPIVSDIMQKMQGSADISIKMRAKEFVKDTLTDFYLDENNVVADEFNYRIESEIPALMQKKMLDNKPLINCIAEFTKNVKAETNSHLSLANYNSNNAWLDLLSAVRTNN